MIKVLFFLVILYFAQVEASCWCRKYVNHGDSYLGMNTGCNDIELQAECKRAEWEMIDWVNAVMAFGRTISLEKAITESNTFNVTQEADNFACLSNSVEKDRPVPDCATGLLTYTDIDGDASKDIEMSFGEIWRDSGRYGTCTSLPLLQECQKVQNGISDYIGSVMINLRVCATPEFVDLMEKRIQGSIVPTITCETTENHFTDDATVAMHSILCIILALFLVV